MPACRRHCGHGWGGVCHPRARRGRWFPPLLHLSATVAGQRTHPKKRTEAQERPSLPNPSSPGTNPSPGPSSPERNPSPVPARARSRTTRPDRTRETPRPSARAAPGYPRRGAHPGSPRLLSVTALPPAGGRAASYPPVISASSPQPSPPESPGGGVAVGRGRVAPAPPSAARAPLPSRRPARGCGPPPDRWSGQRAAPACPASRPR